jgi:CBS domain-containing protein
MNDKQDARAALLNEAQKMESAIRSACGSRVGVIDSNFLCRSVSIIDPEDPVTINEEESLQTACRLLQKHSIGCILVTDEHDKLIGVFSERDYMSKVFEKIPDIATRTVKEFMTPEPITIQPDTPIAYCLNLMSKGGFRHLPVIDPDGMPISIVSIRDVVNYLVSQFVADLELV